LGQELGLETLLPLTVNDEWKILTITVSAEVNTITIPPCQYTCKSENKKISRS